MNQYNEIRSLLRRWGRAEYRLKEIERLKKAISEELDAVADIRPQQLTGMPHGSGVGRPTEENAFRRMAMEKNQLSDLEQEERHLKGIIKDAEWAVSFLDERGRTLLTLHYRDSLPMAEVAEQMHLEIRWAWRLERRYFNTLANFKTN